MAIEIVKPGKLPKDVDKFEGTCSLCGCKVVADKADVNSGYSGMDAQHGWFVDCPTEGCKRQIDMQKIIYRRR
jgi:hypothetical protein